MPELTVPQLQAMAGEIASTVGISTVIFLRLIAAESSWNPNAVNAKSGCVGLCQLSPRFFSDQGNLYNPRENLTIGAKYLKALLKMYDGDYFRALAAYNCGPGRLDRIEMDHGGEWMLHLPRETKSYLRKILLA
jgi:soluble lytic murein transglycosylase-like protein